MHSDEKAGTWGPALVGLTIRGPGTPRNGKQRRPGTPFVHRFRSSRTPQRLHAPWPTTAHRAFTSLLAGPLRPPSSTLLCCAVRPCHPPCPPAAPVQPRPQAMWLTRRTTRRWPASLSPVGWSRCGCTPTRTPASPRALRMCTSGERGAGACMQAGGWVSVCVRARAVAALRPGVQRCTGGREGRGF